MQRAAIMIFIFIAIATLPATADACVPAIQSPTPYGYIPPTPVPTATSTAQEQFEWQVGEIEYQRLIADLVFRGKAIVAIAGSTTTQLQVTLAPNTVWKGTPAARVEVAIPSRPTTDCDFLSGPRPPLINVWFVPDVEYLVYASRTAAGVYEALPRTRAISDAAFDLALLGPGIALTVPTLVGGVSTSVASAPMTVRPPTPARSDRTRGLPLLLLAGGGLMSAGIVVGARLARRRHARRML
jgi:hypothetical protein